eukprot:1176981-Prorocentrum_minimum.AAC.5
MNSCIASLEEDGPAERPSAAALLLGWIVRGVFIVRRMSVPTWGSRMHANKTCETDLLLPLE